MSNENRSENEVLLIDFLLGRCDEEGGLRTQKRLASDEALRRLRDDIANTFSALKLAVEFEPPGDLVEKTLSRINQARQTEALLAREEMARRVFRPTFSLRELVAVAAAIILLAAVFVPLRQEAKRRAMIDQCCAHASEIGTGILTYANDNGGYLPSPPSLQKRWLPAADQAANSNSASLFRLVKSGHVSPVVFVCPAAEGSVSSGFVAESRMSDFPARRYISYSYQHTLGPNRLSYHSKDLSGLAQSMAILADDTPVFRNGRFLRDRVSAATSDNHGGSGQNVLYLDWHVEWKENASAGVQGNNIYLAEGIYDYQGDETPVSPTDTFLLPAFSGQGCTSSQ